MDIIRRLFVYFEFEYGHRFLAHTWDYSRKLSNSSTGTVAKAIQVSQQP